MLTMEGENPLWVILITHLYKEDTMVVTRAKNENDAANRTAAYLGLDSRSVPINDDTDEVVFIAGDEFMLSAWEVNEKGEVIS